MQIVLSDARRRPAPPPALSSTRLFFSRTRALVSSFSIRIVAQLLSSRPRVYSSPIPTSLTTHVPREIPGLCVPRDLRLGEVAEVRKLEEFVQLSYMIFDIETRGDTTSSPIDSPVGRVVGQVLPGRELAPGTHVQPGSFRELRHAAVPRRVAVGEPVAFRRLDVVKSVCRYSRLKHQYNYFNLLLCVSLQRIKKNSEFI